MARMPNNPNASYFQQMKAAEQNILSYSIEVGGTLTAAADLLGISEPYLYHRMEKLGMRQKKDPKKALPPKVVPEMVIDEPEPGDEQPIEESEIPAPDDELDLVGNGNVREAPDDIDDKFEGEY